MTISEPAESENSDSVDKFQRDSESLDITKRKPSSQRTGKDEDLQQVVIEALFSKEVDHVVLSRSDDAQLLESKGFGIRDGDQFYLKDYEVLYLMYSNKLALRDKIKKSGKSKISNVKFTDYVSFAMERDENAWTRFLIFRDLRSRGYVVREGFGFPIDFRVYDRGDYGNKAAKYIVFGLNEGKTMSLSELKKHVDEMSTMGKEAVVAVVERRGEVIYYKVAKWRPIKPL